MSQHLHIVSKVEMDNPDRHPDALNKLMRETREVELFENFKSTGPSRDELHPGFRQKTLFDDQRAVFTPLPSTLVAPAADFGKTAKQHSSILSSTLSEAMLHTDLTADLKYKPQGCGWEDVLNCIAIAKASYDDKGKSSKVRTWARDADATADVLKSLTAMIPDEKGLSVLRQGLVIIFQVITQVLFCRLLRYLWSLMLFSRRGNHE